MLNRYSKVFRRILFVSFLIPASLLADDQGMYVPGLEIGENPRNAKSVRLESLQPVSSGSYDFKLGGQLGVGIDELQNAEKWSIEFFVYYHNQSYRNRDQFYIDAWDEAGNPQFWFMSYPAVDLATNDSVVTFSLVADNYDPDGMGEPLKLSVDPDDINEDGFNWVNISYDGTNLSLHLSNGQAMTHVSKTVPGQNFTEYDTWFWFGMKNGAGENGELSDYNMDALHIMRDAYAEIGPPSHRYAPFEETVMLWNFDEMGGEEVFDETIYNNDGSVAGPDDGVWGSLDVFGGEPIVQGRIGGKLFFDGDVGSVGVYVLLGFPGNDTGISDKWLWAERNTPYPPEGLSYNFADYRITANSGPYWLGAYLDVNENEKWDNDEPGVYKNNIFTNNDSEAFVDLTIHEQQGRISGNVFFDGDVGFAQMLLLLGFPGNDTGISDLWLQRGENTPFPPEGKHYSFHDPQITANSGPYWLAAFFDLNENDSWDDDEPGLYKDDIFTNNDREAFVDLTIEQQGRISGNVFFDGDIGFAQMLLALGFPGNDTDVSDMWQQRGENTPFSSAGKHYSFQGPQITADSGPYWLSAFFDLNENDSWDSNEPGVRKDSIFTNNDSEAFVDLHIVFSPPEIVNISPPTDAHEGEDAEINVGLASAAGISFASFEYIVGGSSSTRVVDLGGDPQGGDWAGTIPASDITSKGLIGRIFVEDVSGQGVLSDPMSIEVSFDEISIGSTSGETYRMISAPGQLDSKASILEALVEDLTAEDRSDDETEFRTFRWNGSDYNETGVARLNPGEAYWIITLDSWQLTGGSGESMDLEDPVSISLRQGWNQVGSPYNFTPNFYNAEEGAVEKSFYRYTGSGYSTTTTMSPGDGYWVYANSSTSLKVGFDSAIVLARESGGDQFEWKGNIIARINGVDDSENIFGVMADASETWDTVDRHEPPVIGNYISVAFDNRHWSERGGFYSRDVHSAQADGHEWPFVVKTNEEGVVSLDFEWTESLPSDWDIALIDRALGKVTDLRAEPAYDFACACDEEGRDFVIITGSTDFTRGAMNAYDLVPAEYQLSQNFPNPFNAVTTLRFSLPEESFVSVAVYDILGQEIATLANRQAYGAGNHALIWDGRNNAGRMMSTGVYLYRMEAFSGGKAIFQDARKLIMLK